MNSSQHFEVLVVGAGLSGLGVAAFLKHKQPEMSIRILEQADRPGGAIQTYQEEGFLAEGGAHGFLDNCLESRVLLHLAGLQDEVEKAPLGRFVRYICLDGALRTIPQSPMKIIRAPLLSWPAKLRCLAEFWKTPLGGDPSVAQWVRHRLGEAMLPFADAVFTGTYAGDIERLSMQAVMPGLVALERKHGSVLRGLLRERRDRQDRKKKKKGLPAMTSFAGGMERLPQGLAASAPLKREIMYRTGARTVTREKEGWRVITAQLDLTCRHLVLALPVNQCLRLLAGGSFPPPPLSSLPEAGLATVVLGFDDRAEIPPGFGYLAPEKEQRFCLGAMFSSHMFPGRAPGGRVLLEALVGGRRHPERLELDDRTIVRHCLDDLRSLMNLPESPCFSKVLRAGGTIPQLERGYLDLLEWRRRLQERQPGLYICGFGWNGIGINDMTKEAWKTAKKILSGFSKEEDGEELKGIYF